MSNRLAGVWEVRRTGMNVETASQDRRERNVAAASALVHAPCQTHDRPDPLNIRLFVDPHCTLRTALMLEEVCLPVN